ncbi:citrate transporter [Enterococcus sp. BWB1-3]|uniref:citrate transporter n=1 Tax=Enterococcus sp. BWB1-3 TaxID=2787713 RepID=UPI001923BAE2|nr:citrate transporter [Enterococcus sp. BWB1-3]MBL1229119.1 citrate transporter [Enterococcus sp. BWB1-3]
MTEVIGIILFLSFIGLVVYSIKGFNLMVGFIVMAALWTILPSIDIFVTEGSITPVLEMIQAVYQKAPEAWGGILVNVFFGAWFGRVLLDTGIAATIIRKAVELGGDNSAVILVLTNIITAVIFTSMSGAGPVLAIAIVILPILFSIGIPKEIALFAFTGSVAAGIFINPINYAQYRAFFADIAPMTEYDYSTYFTFGFLAFVVMISIVSVFSVIYLKIKNPRYTWTVSKEPQIVNAPNLSLLTPFLPVVGVIFLRLPMILCFILAGLFALMVCGEFKGGFRTACRLLTKLYADGVKDTSSLVGFWLCLSMFNAAAKFAGPYFQSIIGGLIPTSAFWLCVLFFVLAPLTWFRGPMSLIGSGAALLAVIAQNPAAYPITFLYPLFISIMIGMGHFDITTSWIAWGLGYSNVEPKDYMKAAIIPGMVICLILEAATFILYGGM